MFHPVSRFRSLVVDVKRRGQNRKRSEWLRCSRLGWKHRGAEQVASVARQARSDLRGGRPILRVVHGGSENESVGDQSWRLLIEERLPGAVVALKVQDEGAGGRIAGEPRVQQPGWREEEKQRRGRSDGGDHPGTIGGWLQRIVLRFRYRHRGQNTDLDPVRVPDNGSRASGASWPDRTGSAGIPLRTGRTYRPDRSWASWRPCRSRASRRTNRSLKAEGYWIDRQLVRPACGPESDRCALAKHGVSASLGGAHDGGGGARWNGKEEDGQGGGRQALHGHLFGCGRSRYGANRATRRQVRTRVQRSSRRQRWSEVAQPLSEGR